MLARAAAALTLLAAATAHDDGMPINPALGVPGFPDCTRLNPTIDMTVGEAAMDLSCAQKAGRAGTIKVGCIGDSITAGVHSSGGNHTYPGQLQIMLDQSYPGKYSVTNLGACGSTVSSLGLLFLRSLPRRPAAAPPSPAPPPPAWSLAARFGTHLRADPR